MGAVLALARPSTAAPGAAAAPAPYFLTVQLDGPSERSPDHVCVVSAGAHPDWSVVQSDKSIGPPDASLPLKDLENVVFTPGAASAAPAPEASAMAAPSTRRVWQFDARSREQLLDAGGPVRARPHIKAALDALVFDDEAVGTCANPGEVCRPSFEIPSKVASGGTDTELLHMACVPNTRPMNHHTRQVLVMFLNTHTGIHPPIRKITLDGSVVTVRFDGAVDDNDVFVASVLGGHYSPGETAASFNRRIVLAPTPRCHETNVELPDYDARSEQTLAVTLTEGNSTLLSCEANITSGFARISLPERTSSEPRKLELRGTASGLRFVTTWSDRIPPSNLRGSLFGVSLYWVRHCLYPADEACPAATLVESGYQCSEGERDADGCAYVCDGEDANVPIRTPETVRFTRATTDETWTGRLGYSGARIDAYVDARERKVLLTTEELSGDFLTSDLNVSRIDLLLPGGAVKSQGFSRRISKAIDVPGAECDQDIIAHYVGARVFAPSMHSLDGGVISLAEPQSKSLWLDMASYLAVGHELKPVWAPEDEAAQGFGTGTSATVGLVIDVGRWRSRWFFQGLVEMTTARREYYVQDESGGRESRGLASNRALLGGAVGFRAGRIASSLGIEGGFSGAALYNDLDVMPLRGVLAGVYRVKVRVGDRSSIILTTRAFYFEQTRIIDSSNALIATEVRNRGTIELGWEWSIGGFIADWLTRSAREGLDAKSARR